MGKKSPPPAPDYVGVAGQQAEASKELTQLQTQANRPDIYTPWGSQTWEQNGNDWTTQISLSPEQQAALDSQMAVTQGRSNAAEGLVNAATQQFQNPLDYSGIAQGANRLNPQQVGAGGPIQTQMNNTAGDWRQRGQDAALDFMRPLQQQRQSGLESQLANMGLTRGSEAWNNEMMRNSDQDMRDQLQAFGAGQSEANMLFGQDLQSGQFANAAQNQGFQQNFNAANANNSSAAQAGNFNQQLRQQQIAEMLQQRSQPLNELNALLTGQQVNSPQMPGFNSATKSDTPQLLNAANMGYQADMDAFNAKQAGVTGAMSGLFDLGGAAMGAGGWGGLFSMSDKRLKTDIALLFTLPNGINVYKYRFIGKDQPEIGVLAQEVMEIMPDAVRHHEDGYLRVNYSMVLA